MPRRWTPMRRRMAATKQEFLPDLSQEQLKTFRETFLLFDVDQSDAISVDELGDVMQALGYEPSEEALEALVLQVDTSGDGEIDFGEFCHMMQMVMISHDSLYDLKLAFEAFDLDGNGYISSYELRQAMLGDGNKLGLTEADVDILLVESDINCDGVIDFQEVTAPLRADAAHAGRGPQPRSRARSLQRPPRIDSPRLTHGTHTAHTPCIAPIAVRIDARLPE